MHLKRFWAPALTAFLLLAGPLTTAHAASVFLSFSGGSGSPMTITLAQPVTYTITTAPTGPIVFDFENVANMFGGTLALAGTISFTINGGAPIPINVGDTGSAIGTIAPADLILWRNPGVSAALGDVVVLSPGSLTTNINIPAGPPGSGLYSALLLDSNGLQVAVGVPEPAALSLLVVGGLCSTARRRRTA